jgi:1,4-alpha-glucan branching enzyme
MTSRTTFSLLGDQDLHWFGEGTHVRLYDKLGAHRVRVGETDGTYFAVWAPNATRVSVIGDWNAWQPERDVLHQRDASGVFEGFIAGVDKGAHYKYRIVGDDFAADKADPFAFAAEVAPLTASRVWSHDYRWHDDAWMRDRRARNALSAPISIYEVHLGSFRRVPEDNNRMMSYREIADPLARHVRSLGFTHVELMPVMEHPFYGSWGYQVTGYFAPTSRYGTPEDLMYLIDVLHQHGIGVILDWVPAHFPNDTHGLARFDGTCLFEHADPRLGFHPDWKSCIFNYGRHEVRSFLISSALFWLDKFHADGIRVDGVASMLYRDYSRAAGEWIPNDHGGRENLDAVELLRALNEAVYCHFPDVQTYAEESTAWPQVSRPTYVGGLGFGLKWDMGFMHDTLQYFARDPVHRKFHHGELTFRSLYAFTENFVLPYSHDEVVHGKGSLLQRMAGDPWQKLANLRLLLAYLYAQPGKKLLFMGSELGSDREWDHERSLDWHLRDYPDHLGLSALLTQLNRLYRSENALHLHDHDAEGIEWLDSHDSDQSVIAFVRHAEQQRVVVVFNFTPVVRYAYRIGVDVPGEWSEVLNTDAREYGGSGQGNLGRVYAEAIPFHGKVQSLALTLPPLAAVWLKPGSRPQSLRP